MGMHLANPFSTLSFKLTYRKFWRCDTNLIAHVKPVQIHFLIGSVVPRYNSGDTSVTLRRDRIAAQPCRQEPLATVTNTAPFFAFRCDRSITIGRRESVVVDAPPSATVYHHGSHSHSVQVSLVQHQP
ncbi:hypothetical protein HanXRQr2_Chr15g0677411 [Helianthus annuus]|uniref:Uncharacterized protein n=1 Tax=Helianthus annuus TaxID=4232 RepID=A0A251S5P0_HELAN|nr:hypothetical protein HanXRQr2_Chr15g0677411 [Helianthus annuus]KAJ0471881.1 hypothetical protein HanHA89_Chr15g0600921 [Helianthus annuus]KAJ0647484.1 hypothetical protein HanLR1_Chr15g0562361 [Helianthus annuus]KAJ0651362.1 hypothetical protein HanOQP8_Chr15g0560171 [Helianthus annuus]KAJ0829935.1 hypothetical protein HanPSC8_Chr15g0649461 [Helianthus annuus]